MIATSPVDTRTFVFPLDFNVFYFNQWAGFETEKLHRFFTHLDYKQICTLKPGDIVWVDQEPYCRHGKVYGYTKKMVRGTQTLLDKSIRVNFEPTGSMTFSPSGFGKSITQVKDEGALKNMLGKLSRFATQCQ